MIKWNDNNLFKNDCALVPAQITTAWSKTSSLVSILYSGPKQYMVVHCTVQYNAEKYTIEQYITVYYSKLM